MAATASLGAASRADTVLIDAAAVYPEGPLWRAGKLLYVEYAGFGIKIWDGKRAAAYWRGELCGASGLINYRHDHLLVACYHMNAVVELDETGKQIRVIDKDGAGRPFVGPNDFAADGAGGSYFSASGVYDLKAPISGTLLYLAPSTARACGSQRCWRAASCPFPSKAAASWAPAPRGHGCRTSRPPLRMRTPTTVPTA